MIENTKLKLGAMVFLKPHKRPFSVKAFDSRFAICTQCKNIYGTIIFAILDFKMEQMIILSDAFLIYNLELESKINLLLSDLNTEVFKISKYNPTPLSLEIYEDNQPTS